MRKCFVPTCFVAFFGIAVWSCQPKPNNGDLLKNMVVSTDYNSTANFSNYSNYWMSLDTISYFLNTAPTDTLSTGAAVRTITNEVSGALTTAGYSLVGKNASPDFWVHIYIVENISTYQSYYYNPYSYGYYGGYYGGYSTVSVSDQSNLYIFLVDLKHKSTGKSYLWGCNIGDLASSPDQTTDTIIRAIDQAFKQSSYIKK
jgi:hypothetical protein